MATIPLTGTFWKAPGDVAWASAPYTIRLVRPFAILGEAAYPRWSRSGTASAEGAISETLTVPDEGTAHFELVAPDGNIYTAHLGAGDTPTVEAWTAAAYTTPTDISTTQSLIDAALEDFAVGAAPVDSVFGRDGAVVAQAADYAAFYATLTHDHDADYAGLVHTHLIADTSGLQAALDAKAASVHTHDDRYFTEAEVTSALALKADTTHDHDADYAALVHAHAIADVTGLQAALDGKAATAHDHTFASLTSKPDTLAGYGITDGATDAELAAGLAAITPASIGAAEDDHLHPTLTVITDSGTARTLALTDAGKHIDFTSGSPITVTVPANATVAFPVGSVIAGARMGAGTLTFAAAGGVTINSAGGLLAVAEQYGAAAIRKVATDTWHLIGALG